MMMMLTGDDVSLTLGYSQGLSLPTEHGFQGLPIICLDGTYPFHVSSVCHNQLTQYLAYLLVKTEESPFITDERRNRISNIPCCHSLKWSPCVVVCG